MAKTQRALIKKYKFNTREDWQRAMDDISAKAKKDREEWSAKVMAEIKDYHLQRRKELKKEYPMIFH
ncbi:MAG: hypothetical protein WCQ60_03095 [bacterium]